MIIDNLRRAELAEACLAVGEKIEKQIFEDPTNENIDAGITQIDILMRIASSLENEFPKTDLVKKLIHFSSS